MRNSVIGENSVLDRAIIAEDVTIGNNTVVGCGEEAKNVFKPAVYAFGLATIGEQSVIPDNVKIGRNTAISGLRRWRTIRTEFLRVDRLSKQRMVSSHEGNRDYPCRAATTAVCGNCRTREQSQQCR